MEEKHKTALLRYEAIKISIKEMEAEMEELKPLLLEVVPEGKEIEARYGAFTLKAKPKWEYSLGTQAMEKDLKETKKREEADGTAKELPGTPYVEYRTKKTDATE